MALLTARSRADRGGMRGNGQDLTAAERVLVRRDIGFAARQAADAVNLLFEGAGVASAALDMPIQRHWRDINAAAGHAGRDVQTICALAGQVCFGLEPVGQF